MVVPERLQRPGRERLRDAEHARIGEVLAVRVAQVCHYMIQPLVELYGGCMVLLKVS